MVQRVSKIEEKSNQDKRTLIRAANAVQGEASRQNRLVRMGCPVDKSGDRDSALEESAGSQEDTSPYC